MLSCLSYSGCPVLFCLPFPVVHMLAVLSTWLSCSISPIPADLSSPGSKPWLSCRSLVPAVLFRLSYPRSPVQSVFFCPGGSFLVVLFWCPSLAVLFWLSCSGCPVLDALFWLSYPGCHVLTVLSWLFCPFWLSCPVLAVLFWQSCPAFLSGLSCPGFPVLVVLS